MGRLLGALLASALWATGTATAAAPAPDPQLQATVERFVAAQNAHDLAAVGGLLLDSADFLWITRGTAIWGRAAALERFEKLYAGTWRLIPDWAEFRVVVATTQLAEVFVPIEFSIGAPDQPPQQARFLMNMVLTRPGPDWRIASLLPIPVPPPAR